MISDIVHMAEQRCKLSGYPVVKNFDDDLYFLAALVYFYKDRYHAKAVVAALCRLRPPVQSRSPDILEGTMKCHVIEAKRISEPLRKLGPGAKCLQKITQNRSTYGIFHDAVLLTLQHIEDDHDENVIVHMRSSGPELIPWRAEVTEEETNSERWQLYDESIIRIPDETNITLEDLWNNFKCDNYSPISSNCHQFSKRIMEFL